MPDRADLTSELWDAPRLARKLGVEVVAHAIVDSTMEEARRDGRAPLVHLADEQRTGRGRHGRRWFSRPGNLHATIAWPVRSERLPAAVLAAIQIEIALSIRAAGGPAVRCKWPNDGFVGGKKWCGLLAEDDRVGDRLLVGIGANLEELPAAPQLRAAALHDHWTPWPGRMTVAEILLGAALATLRGGASGIASRLARWPELDLWPVGTGIRVETPAGVQIGRYAGVAADGRIVLETPEGTVRVAAGQARRVRRRKV